MPSPIDHGNGKFHLFGEKGFRASIAAGVLTAASLFHSAAPAQAGEGPLGLGIMPRRGAGLLQRRSEAYSTGVYTSQAVIDRPFLEILQFFDALEKDPKAKLAYVRKVAESGDTKVIGIKGNIVTLRKTVNLPRGAVAVDLLMKIEVMEREKFMEMSRFLETINDRKARFIEKASAASKLASVYNEVAEKGLRIRMTLQNSASPNNFFTISGSQTETHFMPVKKDGENTLSTRVTSSGSTSITVHGAIGRMMSGRIVGTASSDLSAAVGRASSNAKRAIEGDKKRR